MLLHCSHDLEWGEKAENIFLNQNNLPALAEPMASTPYDSLILLTKF